MLGPSVGDVGYILCTPAGFHSSTTFTRTPSYDTAPVLVRLSESQKPPKKCKGNHSLGLNTNACCLKFIRFRSQMVWIYLPSTYIEKLL